MSLSDHFHRPKFIPLIMSLGAVVLLFGLGIWQLQRLEWKEGLIAHITQANASAPLTDLPSTLPELQDKQFYRVSLDGEYLPSPEFHIAARYFQDRLGYAVLNPFRLTDGRLVLVNRGWIPAQAKEAANHPAAPEGAAHVDAIIRTSNERNYFTPQNQPERNIWFGRDVAEMATFSGLALEPPTLDLVGPQDASSLPVPSDGVIALRNDHLHYAIIWFSIGVGVLVISLLYHRKKQD